MFGTAQLIQEAYTPQGAQGAIITICIVNVFPFFDCLNSVVNMAIILLFSE